MKKTLLYLLGILVFTSCSTYPYAFHLEETSGITSKKKIVVMPLNLSIESKYTKIDRVNKTVIDSVERKLRSYHFEVVSNELIKHDMDSLKESYGGFFSSKTGKADTSKVNSFYKNSMDFVIKKYDVTSILIPYLIVQNARIENHAINWHGRSVYSFRVGNATGNMPALSLYINIYDKNRKLIFDNAGGIQPLSKLNFLKFESISEDELLADPKDLSEAIKIVFEPVNERFYRK